MNARLRLAGLAAASAAVALASTAAGAAPAHESLHGTFSETAAGTNLHYTISGSAKLTVSDGLTVADINVAGLDPTERYHSHLHNQSCAYTPPGGSHYQNTEGGDVDPVNELWLSTDGDAPGNITPNPGGVAHATGSANWTARLASTQTTAKSIVVHVDGVTGAANRIACADLT